MFKTLRSVNESEWKRPVRRCGHRQDDNINMDLIQGVVLLIGLMWLRIETSHRLL